MEIKNIIKKRREELNKTLEEIGNAVGVSKATVKRWESGEIKNLRRDKIAKLADALQIDPVYLLDETARDRQLHKTKGVKIPILGRVQAGIPIEAIEEILDYEEIEESLARTGEFFGLQIKGDSMEPRFIEGDVVIVKKQSDVENGDIAVVIVNGQDAAIKKFKKTDNGIMLLSLNPAYDPIFYTKKQVESLPVTVIGKVIELRGKF